MPKTGQKMARIMQKTSQKRARKNLKIRPEFYNFLMGTLYIITMYNSKTFGPKSKYWKTLG